MKKILNLVLILFTMQNLYSQQSDIPCFYERDSSYLILNKDTAEFKMYNIKYGIRYLKGKGTYYLKDSVIYIKTVFSESDNFTRFEDVGQSELKDKLSIEVFDENNTRVSEFSYGIVGKNIKKEYNRYRETNVGEISEIDLNKVKKPDYIWISVKSDHSLADEINGTHFYKDIQIPVKSIKTDKIKVYLTYDKLVYDTLVRFELGKDNKNIFVFGPKGIYRDEPVKTRFYFITRRLLLPATSNKIIKMYAPCSP